MSKFQEFIRKSMVEDWGELILEGVSRLQVLNVVEKVMELEKVLPDYIDGVQNPKWKEYLTKFHKQLAIVGDILLRK